MILGDLPAEHQPDARAGGLGGEERHEKILDVGDAGPVVLDENLDGPGLTVNVDAAQLEQVIINLVKNAVEAAPEPGQSAPPTCCVRVGWRKIPGAVEIFVEDDGPGIANVQNLFVPFFTTKPSGSGIGLVLCRQIAENHGGALTLENREGPTGCIARLRLPA